MIQDFDGKVAVITGGGHGIGFALAEACLARGMKVAITASRQTSLDEAADKLGGGDALMTCLSDAGDANAVFALAQTVEESFGAVHLLCLNAGISRIATIHELDVETWRRALSINLDGVFYGVKAFLPLLEAQEQSHIVITSSVFGLFAAGMQAPYFASKAGVTAFGESLFYDLLAAGSPTGVSVLLPGNTSTNMAEAGLTGDEDPALAEAIRGEMAAGTPPAAVAEATLDAVRDNLFYVLPNTGDFQAAIESRFDRILAGRNPTPADVGDTI